MWNRLRALINLDTFFTGCGIYYEMLVAMGLAPASHGSLSSADVVPEPSISFADMAGIGAPPPVGAAPHRAVSILPIDQWAIRS
jgi:hypothetical protein